MLTGQAGGPGEQTRELETSVFDVGRGGLYINGDASTLNNGPAGVPGWLSR